MLCVAGYCKRPEYVRVFEEPESERSVTVPRVSPYAAADRQLVGRDAVIPTAETQTKSPAPSVQPRVTNKATGSAPALIATPPLENARGHAGLTASPSGRAEEVHAARAVRAGNTVMSRLYGM